jgi:hypothetical protein
VCNSVNVVVAATRKKFPLYIWPLEHNESTIFENIVEFNRNKGTMDSAEENLTKYLERIGLINISEKSDKIKFDLLRDDKVWWPKDI